jgi:uncharacterized oxidoreductase
MVLRALASPLPIAWVTADSAYGQDNRFRRLLEQSGAGYVLAVAKSHVTAWAGPASTACSRKHPTRQGRRSRAVTARRAPVSITGRQCGCLLSPSSTTRAKSLTGCGGHWHGETSAHRTRSPTTSPTPLETTVRELVRVAGPSRAIEERSQAALDRFAQAHPQALAVRADVTDAADRAALLQAVADRFGRLDVLVNNAGTFEERDYAAGKNPNATLDDEVALNLTAPIHLTGEVLERWPSPDAIVFITSGFALVSPTRAPTHGAVKAGLHGFADGLRRQLAPQGHTHVLEVLPPSTDTPMNAEATGKKLTPAQVAAVTMKALRRGRNMAFPGQTKVMPAMLRIAPGTLRRVVAEL